MKTSIYLFGCCLRKLIRTTSVIHIAVSSSHVSHLIELEKMTSDSVGLNSILWTFGFIGFTFFFFFETVFCYVALADLGLSMQTKLALHLQRSFCLCLLSAGITTFGYILSLFPDTSFPYRRPPLLLFLGRIRTEEGTYICTLATSFDVELSDSGL